MDDKDNKKINKTKASKIWDNILLWIVIVGLAVGFICVIAGIESLSDNMSFKDSLIKTVEAYILLPLSIVALFLIMELFKALFEEHPFICIILIVLIVIAVPKGASVIKHTYHSSENYFTKKDVQTQWNHFEKSSRLGDEYKKISDDYGPLSDEFLMDGGVFLKGSNGLYYAFPKYSKSEISDIDPCTGMLGTAEDLFGYNEDVSLSSFKESLGLTSETEYEGTLNYKKTSSSGYYYVTIRDEYIKNDADYITPDTWISVTPRNRSIVAVGRLVNDQSEEEEIVFYVDGGNRYHKDASCTTLHDSDTIYECYIDDVPDSRTPCDVCY